MIDSRDPEMIESLKYLLVSPEEKIKIHSRSFDSKRSCWIPDAKQGFISAQIEQEKDGIVSVRTDSGQCVQVKKDDIQQMNPPKYEKCDDMADLTYLNDATVLHNLRSRYQDWLIYTYSGLFCVAINPYRRLPVYTMQMINFYRGKKKTEVPPHLYHIADNAYVSMHQDRQNQSLLITGESGAGKTENTKKVIQYFAFVACNRTEKNSDCVIGEANLEDQIVSANPVLEAYGNAKTTRNNNSSRFGKFIRIHFGSTGKIAGADIESYLLEKSRVTFQQPAERNYHIFYQLLSPTLAHYHKQLHLEPNPQKYFYTGQGTITIDHVDDANEMLTTEQAFDTLNFTQNEKLNLFKCTAAIIHFGNSSWKQRPREEQAEADGTDECQIVSDLLGIESNELVRGLLKPRIKVGNEYVNRGQSRDQVVHAIGALSRSVYSRCFSWLVERVNLTLDVKTKRQFFIGVLDIAGFEIFEFNGFEQLCINFTNERLQQFFNHHMFVLEQEEYANEGISWQMMNFGLDLQAGIDLIEKPMGIFSILEEECIVPKASDKTFQEKLYANHLGKHPNFGKPKMNKAKCEGHFDLHHYAGTVSYSVNGWLEKNRDPINTTVAKLFKESKNNELVAYLFRDMRNDDDKKSGTKIKKTGAMHTISSAHRDQLNKLMSTLRDTHPHFVRCIIPNEIKTGGILDAHLVMHQLHCNGVLEGIRICRKGFPNRMPYTEFKQRYRILASNSAQAHSTHEPIKSTNIILTEISLEQDFYRMGTTKIFFRAGVLGQLETLRDNAIARIIQMLQSYIRKFIVQKYYRRLLEQRLCISILQRNIKKYLVLRNWSWWRLYGKLKPLLSVVKREEEMREQEEAFMKVKECLAREEYHRKKLEDEGVKLLKEKNKMYDELETERLKNDEAEEKILKLQAQKNDLENQIQLLDEQITNDQSQTDELNHQKKRLEHDLLQLNQQLNEITEKLRRSEADNRSKTNQIQMLQGDLVRQEDTVNNFTRDRKRLEQDNLRLTEALEQIEDKNSHLTKLRTKLEQRLDETNLAVDKEKRARNELDKAKRKLETDLKNVQEKLAEKECSLIESGEQLKIKDIEIAQFSSRLDEEHLSNASLTKKVNQLQLQFEHSIEELETERQLRSKLEKSKAELKHELDEMVDRLDEVGGLSNAQVELNKRREMELAKLRRDLEEASIVHENVVGQMRRKQQEAVNEMAEKIEALEKVRVRVEKERQNFREELEEMKIENEQNVKSKLNYEKLIKQLDIQIQEQISKQDDLIRQQTDLEFQKNRTQTENSNLSSQLEVSEQTVASFAKTKHQLKSLLDEAKQSLDEEIRARGVFTQQLKNLNEDFDHLKEQLDEEREAKMDVQKMLVKANGEVQFWRSKYEIDGSARAEELEETKRKLSAKLLEAESHVEEAISKCQSLEKNKQRVQCEVEDLLIDVERANANVSSMEKKQRQFDKLINEWQSKCEEITNELDQSQKEARIYSTDVFKLRSQIEEANESVDALRKENKNLVEEIKDLMEQLGDGGRSVHELEKAKRRLEVEKEELHVALEEADGSIEKEEAKVARIQLELSNLRQEIDRRLAEKEEEFENTRRNHQRVIESMQASLESETSRKSEAIKQKKQLETDITELEITLDHSNRNNADLQKTIQRLQAYTMELTAQVEDEQRSRDEAREQVIAIERRMNLVITDLEEVRLALDQSDKAKKSVEMELHLAADRLSELGVLNVSLSGQKRKLESDGLALQTDYDDLVAELKNCEERAKKASMDAARLAEELRSEQEHSSQVEKLRKELEIQIRDLQIRFDSAESNTIKNGKRIIQKLEQKVLELETEVEAEQKQHQEALKEIRKNDRRIKELQFKSDEEHKNYIKLQDLVEKLQSKLKIFRHQLEEAESISQTNLNKYRKAQAELGDAEERANAAEVQLSKMRAKNRPLSTFLGSRLGNSPVRDFVRSASAAPTRAHSVYRT